MSNLYLELFIEKMDWSSDDFKTEISHLKSYNLPNVNLTKEIINDLHTQIILTKGDWQNFDCNVVGQNYYVKVNIIFHSLQLDDNENQIINKVLEKIDSILQDLKFDDNLNGVDNFELLDSIFDEDGLIIKAFKNGSWGVADDLTNLLNSNNIEYKTIRHRQSRFDGGASGGFEEIILFIGASVASGITWDVLKGLLISRLGLELENFKASLINSYKFKQLRKDIAERIVEDKKDLVDDIKYVV